ncbi:N6-adeninemlase domain containing protein, partial [Globisporangium splendens]
MTRASNQPEKQRTTCSFWQKYPEKEELNQYWYSAETVDKLATEVLAEMTQRGRVAFLSIPSVYFAVKSKQTTQSLDCILFDVRYLCCIFASVGFWERMVLTFYLRVDAQFDDKFATEGSHFVHYDFNRPEAIPKELLESFDFLVIDPPFITKEVWQQYAAAARLLLRSSQSKILLSTIGENGFLRFGVHRQSSVDKV